MLHSKNISLVFIPTKMEIEAFGVMNSIRKVEKRSLENR